MGRIEIEIESGHIVISGRRPDRDALLGGGYTELCLVVGMVLVGRNRIWVSRHRSGFSWTISASLAAFPVLLLLACCVPALAVTYSPGVSVGQWVRYGNFTGMGPVLESANATDWIMMEVVAVSGTEVSLRNTGQAKNGTPIAPESIVVYDVGAGTATGIPSVYGPIIPADLGQGDALPIPPPATPLRINKTETRIYMGVSRAVNIVNMTMITGEISIKNVCVYDKASGMLLEMQMLTTIPTMTSGMSYNVIDTNIFTTLPVGESPARALLAVIGIMILIFGTRPFLMRDLG